MKPHVPSRVILSYIFGAVRPYPIAIAVMVFVAVSWAIHISIHPYLLKVILNRLSTCEPQDVFKVLWGPAALFVGITVIQSVSYRAYGYFVEILMIPRLRAQLANEALGHLLHKSHTYYQNNFSGSLTNRVNDLTGSVPEIVQIIFDRFFSHFLALFIAVLTLGYVSPYFAAVMVAWTGGIIGGAMFFSGHFTRLAHKWSEQASLITGRLVDVLSNILSVRLITGKQKEKDFLNETIEGAVRAEKKLQWAYFWMWFFYGFSFVMVQALNFYFLMKGRQEGWITVGDFALVLSINAAIADFLWQLAREFSQFSKLWGRVSQALQAILDAPDLEDQAAAKTLRVEKGEVSFDHVTFQYKGTDPLFKDTSVVIGAGQKVGLVGHSGGGKTTFVNLILRLYDVTGGRVLIDGQDIAQVTQDSLRHVIGMIPQDPSLFHRSLMENIRYGRVVATDAEVIEAAKRAHAHDFITKIPEGYDALVGERGIKLSGGQRQRIAIARAVLKDAPILILDEATSQLDSMTESLIQDSLWNLMHGKTTIVIAHRLSTLLHMDRILVFDRGTIVEDGTHTELLAQGGKYKALWDAQVGGFLPE